MFLFAFYSIDSFLEKKLTYLEGFNPVDVRTCTRQENGELLDTNACTEEEELRKAYNKILKDFRDGCGIITNEKGYPLAATCSHDENINNKSRIFDKNETETETVTYRQITPKIELKIINIFNSMNIEISIEPTGPKEYAIFNSYGEKIATMSPSLGGGGAVITKIGTTKGIGVDYKEEIKKIFSVKL